MSPRCDGISMWSAGIAVSYLSGTCRVHWEPPAGEYPGCKGAVMGKTAAEGELHLGTGCEGPLPPLRSASEDKQHIEAFGLVKMSRMDTCCNMVRLNLYVWLYLLKELKSNSPHFIDLKTNMWTWIQDKNTHLSHENGSSFYNTNHSAQ